MPIKVVLRTYEPRILLLMSGIMLVNLLAAIDQTALSNALPSIRGDLGESTNTSWVVTIYLMALPIFAPLFGNLGDVYGRKPILKSAILIFVVASLGCGFSASTLQLIGCRALQGVGAAGIFSIPNAILADVIAPRERGRYQIFISIVWVCASLGGATLGAALMELGTWRLIFLINLPIGLSAFLMIQLVRHQRP